MIAHAQLDAPYECCGLLAGEEKGGIITEIYRINNLPSDDPRISDLNIPADRRLRYMMDPEGQFFAMKDMRNRGTMMMGIYHSHPHSSAYPSATDLRLAFYSDIVYFIVSLAENAPDLRAFFIVDNIITEEQIDLARGG